MKLQLVAIHVDCAHITKGHMKEAAKILGSTKLGWFHENHYNTHSLVLFDANQHNFNEIEKLYAPYEQFGNEDKTEWFRDYMEKHGWANVMVFDLDTTSVVGHGEISEILPHNVLIVNYWDTQNIPKGNDLHNVEEETCKALSASTNDIDLDNEDWNDEVSDKLPTYLQTVHRTFHFKNEDHGIVVVNEEGAVQEV